MKKILILMGIMLLMVGCSAHGQSMSKEEFGKVGFMLVDGLKGDYYNCTFNENDYTPKNKKWLDVHNIDCSNGKKNDPAHADFFEKLENHVRKNHLQISNTYAVEAVMMTQNYMEDHFPMMLSREKATTMYFVFGDSKANIKAYDLGNKDPGSQPDYEHNTFDNGNKSGEESTEAPEGFDIGSDEENVWRKYVDITDIYVFLQDENPKEVIHELKSGMYNYPKSVVCQFDAFDDLQRLDENKYIIKEIRCNIGKNIMNYQDKIEEISGNGLRIDKFRDPEVFKALKEAYDEINSRTNYTDDHRSILIELKFK